MLSKCKLSLSTINYRLYFALFVLGLAPTLYTTVRVFSWVPFPENILFQSQGNYPG